ncbi:MAG: SPOR domain-containing protein [Treponema sp.]|jgi:DedD protein|nr:SPOR domain-containing protein [Treponema sp.]
MEREQKKLLLVAVSVGVFLLVTVTVAIIILTPKLQPQETSFSPSGQIQNERQQPEETSANDPLQAAINNTQETNININYENPALSVKIDNNDGERITVQIPKPSSPAVPGNSETAASAPVRTQPVNTPAASSSRPAATAVQPAAEPRQTAVSRQAVTVTINDYWIQAGAFLAKVRAEDTKELLASKGFTSIVENREIDGRLWYRVRLGPYTSESEANHWLFLIKTIDGFEESQVRQTVRQQ